MHSASPFQSPVKTRIESKPPKHLQSPSSRKPFQSATTRSSKTAKDTSSEVSSAEERLSTASTEFPKSSTHNAVHWKERRQNSPCNRDKSSKNLLTVDSEPLRLKRELNGLVKNFVSDDNGNKRLDLNASPSSDVVKYRQKCIAAKQQNSKRNSSSSCNTDNEQPKDFEIDEVSHLIISF